MLALKCLEQMNCSLKYNICEVSKELNCITQEMANAAASLIMSKQEVTCPMAKLIDGNNHKKAVVAFQHATVAAEVACVEAAALAASDAVAASASPSIPSTQLTLSVTTCESSIFSICEPSPRLSNQTQDSNEIPQVIQGRIKLGFVGHCVVWHIQVLFYFFYKQYHVPHTNMVMSLLPVK